MRNLFLLLVLSLSAMAYSQEEWQYSVGNDVYTKKFVNLPIVRNIYGGTIINVDYIGDQWTNESKGAFEFACKIWEEKLPPCLPIKLTVQFGKLRGGPANALSSVKPEKRIDTYIQGKVTSAQIKAIFLDGYNKRDNHSYLEYANEEFINSPDATIIYNIDRIDDFSFSIDETSSNKYDFVSLALRDIAKVLGFYTSIIAKNGYISVYNEQITPFDRLIIGNFSSEDPNQRYKQATSGNFKISIKYNQYYNLYTPNPFIEGKSLQEFYPDPTLPFSEVLSYDFSKGMVVRNLGEDITLWLTKNMGWYSDVAVGGGGSSENKEYSTENVIPYKGEIKGSTTNKIKTRDQIPTPNNQISKTWIDPTSSNIQEFFETYCQPYNNFLGDKGDKGGWYVSILKKDGTWDLVYEENYPYELFWLDTKDLNITNTENYARTCDGYLRCRISYCIWERDYPLYPDRIIRSGFSEYYVLDYLPQKPKAQYVKVVSPITKTGNDYTADIKIAIKDIEGTEKIYVEALEEGERVPVVYEINDFKKGYFTTNVYTDCSTKFTLKAINKNGITYSDPITVKPINSIKFKFDPEIYGDFIKLKFTDEDGVIYEKYVAKDYQIHSLNSYVTSTVKSGNLENTNVIDIGSLDKGLYVLNVKDEQNKTYSTKFQK